MSIASCPEGFRHGLRASRQWQSLRLTSLKKQWSLSVLHPRTLNTETPRTNDVPFRKLLKDEAKRRRGAKRAGAYEGGESKSSKIGEATERLKRWDLTVGIEVHAQLNTERKLFSASRTSIDDEPNTNVSVFDLAFPGSQPELQPATLLPALRAAIALNCQIQHKSKFDRKHYFYQDQPAGYQITQYYEPFAINGHLDISQHDGMNLPIGQIMHIDIKQVQMEQDTAKSNLQPSSTTLLDFNRVGHPLIEIITHPEIHSAQGAAACVRKIQSILKAVNAVTTGMENGGLRADVNVSVSPKGSGELGQRTEIKNLSSFKAVEDAVVAERDRQIDVLESGGSIQGETRGWTLGSTETTKLRGKEGEVDYRYMPDPDILPLIIGKDLVEHIFVTLPPLPDALINDLVEKSGLSEKDARTLVLLDDGDRLDYFDEVRAALSDLHASSAVDQTPTPHDMDKIVANWVIHEVGGLLSTTSTPFTPTLIPPHSLALIIFHLHSSLITGTTAKRLLAMVFSGVTRDINTIIDEEDLTVKHVALDDYQTIAQGLIDGNANKVEQIRKGQLGKVKWFVGQMMRMGQGKLDAVKAEQVLRELLGLAEAKK